MIEPEHTLTQSPTQSLHARIDGWTVNVQADFIAALVDTGSVSLSARIVGMHVTSAYRCRARHPAFAEAWDAARRLAYVRLQDEAIDRALNGTRKEIWHDGEFIADSRVMNDKLLVQMLVLLRDARPDQDRIQSSRRPHGLGEGSNFGAAMLALTAPVTLEPADIKRPRKARKTPSSL